MKAIEIECYGAPEVLRLTERADPVAGRGEVLIRVAASGVNRPDVLQRKGLYPVPPGASDLPGLEVAGTIVSGDPIAMGDARLIAGDRVCALVAGGGYAELCVAPVGQCLPVPRDLSDIEAASLPETFFTVWSNVFDRGRLAAGETFLVQGGTSGIGVTAIQMAKAAGAKVIATGRGADKAATARKLGADIAVDTTSEDFAEVAKAAGGVDVVLDMVGGDYIPKNLDALKTGGRIVFIAALGGGQITLPVFAIMMKRAVITGSTLRPRDPDEKARLAREVERIVWPWLLAGKLAPPIDKTFPLSEAAAAHAYLETGSHVGKIVLTTG